MNTDHTWPKWMGVEPRRNAPWTEAEELRANRSFTNGAPLKAIAYEHGRAVGGIVSRLRQCMGEEVFEITQRERLSNRGTYLGHQMIETLVQAEIDDNFILPTKHERNPDLPISKGEKRAILHQMQELMAVMAKTLEQINK